MRVPGRAVTRHSVGQITCKDTCSTILQRVALVKDAGLISSVQTCWVSAFNVLGDFTHAHLPAERHMQRHEQKDAEAGGPGRGIVETRKRMWLDADGQTIVAKRPLHRQR